MPKKIKLTTEKIGTIKTTAYHEGVSGGVKVYLMHDGDFFGDRHPDYYPEDHYDWDDGNLPCGCCSCCGCDCDYYFDEEDYE